MDLLGRGYISRPEPAPPTCLILSKSYHNLLSGHLRADPLSLSRWTAELDWSNLAAEHSAMDLLSSPKQCAYTVFLLDLRCCHLRHSLLCTRRVFCIYSLKVNLHCSPYRCMTRFFLLSRFSSPLSKSLDLFHNQPVLEVKSLASG
jgi:hypothetical protein